MKYLFLLLILIFSLRLAFGDEKEDYFALTQSYKDGLYNLTLSASRAFLKEYPESSFKEDVILMRGLSFYHLGKFPQAVDTLTPLKKSPNVHIRDETCFYLGKLYILAGEKKEALENFLFLVENSQEKKILVRTHYELGLLHFQESNYDSAIEEWRKVLDIGGIPSDIKSSLIMDSIEAYLRTNKIKDAEDLIDKYLKKEGPNFYYFQGRVNFYEKNYSQGLEKFDKIINSDYPEIWKQKAKLGKVWILIDKKDFKTAEEVLSTIQEFKSPEVEKEFYYLKAYLFYKKSEFNPAIRYYHRFISKYKSSSWIQRVYLELVDCYYNIGKLHQAENVAQEFFRLYPDSSNKDSMHYLLGWVYYKAGELEKSMLEFEWVSNKSEDVDLKINSFCRVGDLLSELGRFDEAIEQYNFVLKNYPNSLYAEYAQYQLGIDLLEKKDYDSAILALTAIVKNFPKSSFLDKVYYHLALAYFKKGDEDLALDEINTLLNSFPNSPLKDKAVLKKGILLYNLGRYEEAIKLLENYKPLANNEYLHFILAKAYMRKDKYKLAEKEYDWLKENLKSPELLSYLYFQIGELDFYRENWEEAFANFENAYQISSDRKVKDEALYWQGWCYYNKGDLNKALTIFEKLQNSQEMKNEARYYSALILRAQGKLEEAIKILESFTKSENKFSRLATLKLADIYKDLKEYEKALLYYRKLEKPPYDVISAEASFKIGEVYEERKEYDAALLQYLKLASLYEARTPFVNRARLRSARILESEGRLEEAERIYSELSSGKGEEAIYAQERLKQLKQRR